MNARLEFIGFIFVMGVMGVLIKIYLDVSEKTKEKPLIWAMYVVVGFVYSFCLDWGPMALLKPEIYTEPRDLEYVFEVAPVTVCMDSGFPVYYTLETEDMPASGEILYTGPFEVEESTRVTAYAVFGPFQSPENEVLVKIELQSSPGSDHSEEESEEPPPLAGKTEEAPEQDRIEEPPDSQVPVLEALVLSEEWITLDVGDRYPLSAEPVPADAPLAGLTWFSTDERVAACHGGYVEAYSPGLVTVTAEWAGVFAEALVEVRQPHMVEIWSENEPLHLKVGEEDFLSTCWSGDSSLDWEDLPVQWVVDDPDIAEVWPDGTVYAVSEGSCRARLELIGDASGFALGNADCEIIVSEAPREDVALEIWWPEADLEIYELYEIDVYGTDGCEVWFESEDSAIIWVDRYSGQVIPQGIGEAYVTVWINGCGYQKRFSVWDAV